MSDIRIALDLVASATGAASISSLIYAFSGLQGTISQLNSGDASVAMMAAEMLTLEGMMVGAAADALAFDGALKLIVDDAASLQFTSTQMDLALHGTQAQIDALNPKIIEWADNSMYTTAQVHQLVTALSEHGLDVSQIMNGDAEAAIYMGEAMGIQPVEAANLLASVLQMYAGSGLTATQATNILTAAFYNGVPSAEELQQALDYVGGTAQTLGISLPDLTANIDLLAQAGLPAAQSGASLRYVLQSITDPTTKAAAAFNYLGITQVRTTSPAFEELRHKLLAAGGAAAGTVKNFDGTSVGLNAMFKQAQQIGLIPLNETFNEWAISSGAMSSKLFDAKGNFIGLGNSINTILDQIRAKAHGNKELELNMIEEMFNVRSGKAVAILAGMTDYKNRYQKIIKEMGQTSAKGDANKLLDTLSGSWKELQTTFTSFMATAGAPLLGFLTNVVQGINGFLSSAMKAHPGLVQFFGIFVGVGAILAPLALVIMAVAFAVIFLDGALLPIIIIALAVAVAIAVLALIIAGIIEIVMHWGQITHWLQQQWKRFTDWLGSHVQQALTAVGGWFQWLGKQAKEKFDQLVSWVRGVWNGFTTWLGNAAHNVVNTVVGWFTWLYNHNYYFKDLVDFIHHQFDLLKSGAERIWKNIVSFIQGQIHLLQSGAEHIWKNIVSFAQNQFTLLKSGATRIWNEIVTGIQKEIAGLEKIGDWIQQHVVKPVEDKFTQMASSAFTWGKNLLTSFGNGLASMAGWLKGQAENALGGLAKILGFHSPAEEGPGKDADTWAPNLMRMYAAGIINSTHLVQSAALNAAGAVRTGLTSGMTPGMLGAGQVAASGNTTVTVQVGSDPLFQLVMNRLTGQLQVNGMARHAR